MRIWFSISSILRLQLFEVGIELRRFLFDLFGRDVHSGQNVGDVLLAIEVFLFAFQQLRRNTFGDRGISFAQHVEQRTGSSIAR